MQDQLQKLFFHWSGERPLSLEPLPRSGSDRQYFRVRSKNKSAIAVFNPDTKENLAFLGFTKHFKTLDLPVPEIYAEDITNHLYLQEDLGDMTLFRLIQLESENTRFSDTLLNYYKKVLEFLPRFQITAGATLDFTLCYPRDSFDHQSMMWDLNYFKYYFLKLAGISFDEQELENDYQKLTGYLMETPQHFFLYRDFQSRNIMIHEDQLHFIDYQGGRRGALQYDLASLLFDAKANIPNEVREDLLAHYLEILQPYQQVDRNDFIKRYYAFVLIRIMQAMGAYGFRGFYQQKSHFLASIPYALKNLEYILQRMDIPVELGTLIPVLHRICQSEKLQELGKTVLQVNINSFSFKRGIPVDESGHGGGHVFDCRALPNPGRLNEYKSLTGMDQAVMDFLEKEAEVHKFFELCSALTQQSVENYQSRQFSQLSISFGCTGGQHRSVFMAEKLARELRKNPGVKVMLRHREQEMINGIQH